LPVLVENILASLGAADAPAAAALRRDDLLAELGRYAWQGNVRELRNYLERCLALCEPLPPGDGEAAEDVGAALPDVSRPLKAARAQWTALLEKRYVTALLERHGGNVTAAARGAGVDRMHFYRLLWRYGLR